MKILVTGAKGFVGKNLCAQLKNNKQEVFEFSDMADGRLDSWCAEADFVFNLVGIDVPDDPKEMKAGNVDFSARLLDTLKRYGNKCPVMHASSLKASLAGRFGNSEYGKARKPGRISSSSMRRILASRCWFTGCRVCSVNGLSRSLTEWLGHSAMPLPMISRIRSMTLPYSWI